MAKYGLKPREFPRAVPSGTPLGSGHISPYIPHLVLIQIQYNHTVHILPPKSPFWQVYQDYLTIFVVNLFPFSSSNIQYWRREETIFKGDIVAAPPHRGVLVPYFPQIGLVRPASGRSVTPTADTTRARQNGDHSDRWSRKVWIFDGKFYWSFMLLRLLFDGKTISVTKKYIITNHLMIIGMILMIIRISIPKTK